MEESKESRILETKILAPDKAETTYEVYRWDDNSGKDIEDKFTVSINFPVKMIKMRLLCEQSVSTAECWLNNEQSKKRICPEATLYPSGLDNTLYIRALAASTICSISSPAIYNKAFVSATFYSEKV